VVRERTLQLPVITLSELISNIVTYEGQPVITVGKISGSTSDEEMGLVSTSTSFKLSDGEVSVDANFQYSAIDHYHNIPLELMKAYPPDASDLSSKYGYVHIEPAMTSDQDLMQFLGELRNTQRPAWALGTIDRVGTFHAQAIQEQLRGEVFFLSVYEPSSESVYLEPGKSTEPKPLARVGS